MEIKKLLEASLKSAQSSSLAFDREYARSRGINVSFYEYLLMIFIALTIVFSLRMVGIVLVISLLTIPQITAHLFTNCFKRIIFYDQFFMLQILDLAH